MVKRNHDRHAPVTAMWDCGVVCNDWPKACSNLQTILCCMELIEIEPCWLILSGSVITISVVDDT